MKPSFKMAGYTKRYIMPGILKKLLDDIAKSEREAIALLGIKDRDATEGRRLAAAERWEWIVRHSATTMFRGITETDLVLGREC
jgi:hypothetical protein